jgi:hypothetical protein
MVDIIIKEYLRREQAEPSITSSHAERRAERQVWCRAEAQREVQLAVTDLVTALRMTSVRFGSCS